MTDEGPVPVSSRDAIELEMKSFTGAPAYSADGDMIVPHQDPVKYTGMPSPEIDMAWDKLVDGKSQQTRECVSDAYADLFQGDIS